MDIPSANEVRDAINNNDVERAKALIRAYGLMHPKNVKPE
jgi:hypothetical protein